MTYISVDRRMDLWKAQLHYVLVHQQDVEAALALLRRHGETAEAHPAGGYAFPGAHRIQVATAETERAIRMVAAAGAGALAHIEGLGVPLASVVVSMRQAVVGGEVETSLHVGGERVWPVSVAA